MLIIDVIQTTSSLSCPWESVGPDRKSYHLADHRVLAPPTNNIHHPLQLVFCAVASRAIRKAEVWPRLTVGVLAPLIIDQQPCAGVRGRHWFCMFVILRVQQSIQAVLRGSHRWIPNTVSEHGSHRHASCRHQHQPDLTPHRGAWHASASRKTICHWDTTLSSAAWTTVGEVS